MKSSVEPPTILLLGNSFANQLYPGFANNKNLRHHTILSIGTCGIGADGSGVDARNPCYKERVEDQAIFIDGIISKNPSIRYVILDGWSSNPNPGYVDRVIRRIDFFEKLGLNVIIFTPHITPEFHPKACFKSPLKQNPRECFVSSDVRISIRRDFQPLVLAVRNSHPNVLFFEQNDIFCDREDGRCSYVRDGLPLYRDEVHISEHASLLLQKYFTNWAADNIPSILDPISKGY